MWQKIWTYLTSPNYDTKAQIAGFRFLVIFAIAAIVAPLAYHYFVPVKTISQEKQEMDSLKLVYASLIKNFQNQPKNSYCCKSTYNSHDLQKNTANYSNSKATTYEIVKFNLNTASIEQLATVRGIGQVLAERIIKYRDRMGGFYSQNQLYEVYGLDSLVVQETFKHATGELKPNTLIAINSEEFKIVLKHPYLEYEDVKIIFKNRPIASREMLIRVLPVVGEKMSHYVRYD